MFHMSFPKESLGITILVWVGTTHIGTEDPLGSYLSSIIEELKLNIWGSLKVKGYLIY